MLRLTICLCSLALGFSVAGVAGATTVGFDLAGASGSSQTLIGTVGSANLASALDGNLGSQVFYLSDGETKTIDMSGGTLGWDPKTLPDLFTVAGNSLTDNFQGGSAFVVVNTLGLAPWAHNLRGQKHPWQQPTPGSTPNPDPNPAGGTAPVPEPGTILLLGSGFIGLALYGRMRMRR
jgi:hypothetical protein